MTMVELDVNSGIIELIPVFYPEFEMTKSHSSSDEEATEIG